MMARYTENANYLFNYLFSLKEISFSDKMLMKSEVDIYGFKKSLISLTKFGKIISLSSLNG